MPSRAQKAKKQESRDNVHVDVDRVAPPNASAQEVRLGDQL